VERAKEAKGDTNITFWSRSEKLCKNSKA